MASRVPERVIPVAWGASGADRTAVYPVDLMVEASERQGLLRDISEVFTKEKMNVTSVNSQSVGGLARMGFTVEVVDAARLKRQFEFARDVVREVPVARLSYPRRRALLPEVCDVIVADVRRLTQRGGN